LILRGDPQPDGPPIAERIAKLGLARHVTLMPRLPREQLPALYSAASASIFPSLYEGAGIPIIEAQACGCPVVSSNIPAAKEFGGDSVQYFDPVHTQDIADAMVRIGADAGARRALREGGLSEVKRFEAAAVARG
jgi:glycosyltransferase involved in cell wall biosynthesis